MRRGLNRSYAILMGSTSAIIAATAGGNSAYAQEVAPLDVAADEIIVTANKREESISRVGITIKAFGAEELQRQQIRSLQDIAQATPSLVFSQSEMGTPVYTLRGIGFYETSLAAYPTVSAYLDQAPLPFPALSALTAFDLERIEVLKGPQGILFGNNATGGAINYIAAKPTDELSAGASLTYGRFSTVAADGFISGPISPTLRARAAFSLTKGSGYQISATRPNDRNGAPDTLAVRAIFDWEPSDRLSLQLNLNGWRDRTEPPAAQFVFYSPTYAPAPVNGPFIPNATSSNRVADWSTDYSPRADNRLYQATLRADYRLTDDITATSITAYTDYKHDQVPEGDGLPQHRQDFAYNTGTVKSFSQELRLANDTASQFRWLVGGNYARDRVFEDDFVDFRDGTTGANPAFLGWRGDGFYSRQRMSNYAIFTNGEFDVGPLTLKAGARYTKSNRSTSNCVYAANDPNLDGAVSPLPFFFNALSELLSGVAQPVPGTRECFNILPDTFLQGAYIRKLNEDNVSWRVGVDYKASEDILLYLNVAKGYKAGGFPTLSGTGTAFVPVTQESVQSYEGGIKAQIFDRRLSVNLAGFYFDYRDKQLKSKTIDIIFGPIDALVNIPKSSIKGVELEFQARPVRGLTLGGAVTYLDASIDRFTGVAIDGSTGTFDGSRIPYTPEWQLGGNATYQFPVSANAEAFIAGQVNYRSSTNSVIGYPALFELPSYTLVDLQAGVEFENGKYRLTLWGKNVMNEFYVTNVVSSVVDGVARYTGRPATYGATVSLRY